VPREAVGNWLHGVAYRTALEARRAAARRWARERSVSHLPDPAVEAAECLQEVWPVLDRELLRLPAKYRTAVLLCDLEGRTRKEAARQLGLPEGTVASRLARARSMLAKRLARHGLGLSGGALAALLSEKAMAAAVPDCLAAGTIKAMAL